jgi:DNA polymerase III delta subunit
MALKTRVNRTYTFDYSNGLEGESAESFSVTFKFPFSEDSNKFQVKKNLKKKFGDFEFSKIDEKDDKWYEKLSEQETAYLTEMSDTLMRKSLIDQKDIFDENGGLLVIIGPDGAVNEEVQKAIFDEVKKRPDLYTKVVLAYYGADAKNSKTGATPV